MKNPCKGCTERKMGCHIICQKYIAWRKERDKANEASRRYNEIFGLMKKNK